jgi:O-antigen/teichoic acid export membrane protein
VTADLITRRRNLPSLVHPIKIFHHLREDSLYRNSAYLLINMGVAAVTGFAFVVVCTRFYPQKDVGYATALMGAVSTASAISNLGMNRTIVRFMGRSKTKSEDLAMKLLMVIACALVAGICFSFFFRSFGLKDTNWTTVIIFIAAVVLMSVKTIFDTVFIANLAASGTLIESSFAGLSKLVFLILVIGSGFIGIVSAQLAAALVAIIVSVILLKRRHGFNFRARPSTQSMRGKWRFTLGGYTADLVGGLPSTLLPIIVVARLGPVAGALWYVVMNIITLVLTVSSTINQAMFAEMANATGSVGRIAKKATLTMYGLVLPLSLFIFIFAPYILRIFKGDYVEAEGLLRLMTVFALIGVANFVSGSILALYKKVMYLALTNLINAIVVIIYCLMWAHNLNGIAIGWMYGELVNLVLFVGGGLYISRKHHGNLLMEEV